MIEASVGRDRIEWSRGDGKLPYDEWMYIWQHDAETAKAIAFSIVLAFAVYNWLRAIAQSWSSDGSLWVPWVIIIMLTIWTMMSLNHFISRRREHWERDLARHRAARMTQDHQAGILIVGTLSRVLGLCIVGAMRKTNPGLQVQLQEWFVIGAFFAIMVEVICLTFFVLIMVVLLSKCTRGPDDTGAYGCLAIIRVYPEEVVGFGIALGIVWTFVLSGLLGDMVRWCPLFSSSIGGWSAANVEVWFHALFCLLAALLLFQFWKRVILKRMMMDVRLYSQLHDQQKEIHETIKGLSPVAQSAGDLRFY